MGNTKRERILKLEARRFHLENATYLMEKAVHSITTAIKGKGNLKVGKNQFSTMNILRSELASPAHYEGCIKNLIRRIDQEIDELKK